jgi:hypothetical protein
MYDMDAAGIIIIAVALDLDDLVASSIVIL